MSDRIPILEADAVTKTYPGEVQALADVSLTVHERETVALIGESGCGKTTLLRLFNRMVEPTSGTVRVRGEPVLDLDPIALRRHTGYVQQEAGLLPHWTVARNVALVPALLGWSREQRESRTNELLELVGLAPDEFRTRYPRELSGGQRQRVAVARALAADPPVILLDEPFGALDALTRLDLQDEFVRLKLRLHKTMVLVTHDLSEAFRLGDRIAVLQAGRILQVGTPEDLLHRPAHEYVSALLEHQRAAELSGRGDRPTSGDDA